MTVLAVIPARGGSKGVRRLGHIACLSFGGNKLTTIGGGGMVVTDNATWARRAKYLTTQAKDAGLEFIHGEVGFNYRLTNIQATLGVEQMEQFIEAKRAIAGRYGTTLSGVPDVTPVPDAEWGRVCSGSTPS